MFLGVALALIIGFGILLYFAMSVSQKNTVRKAKTSLNRQAINDRWEQIESTFSLGGPSNFKSAILEADKLVDHVLKGLGLPGETMGERLKGARKRFVKYDDYNNLWYAHKVRNNVAHEISHEIHSAEAKKAMEYFRKALKELKVL